MTQSRPEMQAIYETIADHFSETRATPWPEVQAFLAEQQHADVGLDIGCGNGRHLEVLTTVTDRAIGIDLSRTLLERAQDRCPTASLAVGDGATLPVADRSIGLGLYIATIHHLPDRSTRRASLDELERVLHADGRALVSTWSTAHDRFDRTESFDTTIEWTLPSGETVPRYYHIYAPSEFRAAIEGSALSLVSMDVSSGNCYAIVTSDHDR